MVAVNPRFTFLALSLASLSLTDAAAIHARSSDAGSPTKPSRQQAPVIPMPMKMTQRRELDDALKRSQFHKSRVAKVNTPLSERQKQAHFDIKNRVTRRHVESRQVQPSPPGTPGHVDITSPSTSGPNNSTTIGHLMLNTTSTPYVLDASEKNMTTLYMVPSDSNHCTLQLPVNATQYCATFDPNPPAPEPLTMMPCFNASTETTQHASQTFLYDSGTGVVQPMWYNGEDDGKTDEAASVSDEEAADPDAEGPNADASGTILNSRDSAQNVTLVFVPNAAAAEQQDVAPNSMSATQTVTTTVTPSATPSFVAADFNTASQSMSDASKSTSLPADRYFMPTTSSDASTATPSFAAADVDAASSSTTGVPSQSTNPSFTSAYSGTSSSPSFSVVDMDASSTDVPSQSTMSPTFVSATSSDGSAATPSFAAADMSGVSPSSTDIPSQSTASPTNSPSMPAASSDASTVGALDVQVAAGPSSTIASSSSYSSVPSATASSVDAAAIAANIASSTVSSFSDSASMVSTSSSSASAASSMWVSPSTNDEQAVYVGGSNVGPAARAEMTPVSTAPYQWKFRAEPRL